MKLKFYTKLAKKSIFIFLFLIFIFGGNSVFGETTIKDNEIVNPLIIGNPNTTENLKGTVFEKKTNTSVGETLIPKTLEQVLDETNNDKKNEINELSKPGYLPDLAKKKNKEGEEKEGKEGENKKNDLLEKEGEENTNNKKDSTDGKKNDIYTTFKYNSSQKEFCQIIGRKIKKGACNGKGNTVYLLEGGETATDLINVYFGFFISFLIKAGVLAGILIVVIGGIKISMSGDDESSEGKEKIVLGITVVCLVIFSGVILNAINPLFFVW